MLVYPPPSFSLFEASSEHKVLALRMFNARFAQMTSRLTIAVKIKVAVTCISKYYGTRCEDDSGDKAINIV